jgi:hypothetical protein
MASATNVTVLSSDGGEVVLLTQGSPEFEAAARPFADSQQARDLLPYTVLIKNVSGRDLIAYSVRLASTDSNGVTKPLQILIPRDFVTFRGSAVVTSGSSKLISFVTGLTAPRRGNAVDPASADRFRQTAEFYRAQHGIVISLELAIFEDGTAIGPDRDHKLPILKAWIDAERDFARAVLSVNDLGAFASEVRAIRDRGYEALPADAPRDAGGLYVAAEMSKRYTDCYRFAQAHFAAQVAQWIDQTDVNSARQRLMMITGNKQYPVIQRKGQ